MAEKMRFRLRRGNHQTGNAKAGTLRNYGALRTRYNRDGVAKAVPYIGNQHYFTDTGRKHKDGSPIFAHEVREEALPHIVESEVDLVERFGANKFVRLTSLGQEPEMVDDGLESMSVEALQELAAAEEVDLTGVRKKAEIIERIRGAGIPA